MNLANISFNNLVETLYALPLEDRLEIKTLLERNITDSRRNEIAGNYSNARKAQEANELQFSEDINELKKLL